MHMILRTDLCEGLMVLLWCSLGTLFIGKCWVIYSGAEDAYDMRKAMPRDVHKISVVPLKRPVHPRELEFD